jgi:hypothetical protein
MLQSVSSICTEYCLHFWEVIGVWISGLGTLAAVTISMRLARRTGPVIKASADIRVLIYQGAKPPHPEYVAIDVKNIGEREVMIEGVGWLGRAPWHRANAVQFVSDVPNVPRPPCKVNPGERVTFLIELDQIDGPWTLKMRGFFGRWPALEAYFLRVSVWTPTGVRATARIGPELRKLLIKTMRAS